MLLASRIRATATVTVTRGSRLYSHATVKLDKTGHPPVAPAAAATNTVVAASSEGTGDAATQHAQLQQHAVRGPFQLPGNAMRIGKRMMKSWQTWSQGVRESGFRRPVWPPEVGSVSPADLAGAPAIAGLLLDASSSTTVLKSLSSCSADDLNRLFTHSPSDPYTMPLTVAVLRRLHQPADRQRLLALLCHTRIEELSTPARASIIHALYAEGRPMLSAASSRAIVTVFKKTKGLALTHLKEALNIGSIHLDLQRLLFQSLRPKELRYEVLQHFACEAAAAKASGALPIQVITDFDDTIQLNWKDKRYPRGTIYPGALTFVDLARRVTVDAAGHRVEAASVAQADEWSHWDAWWLRWHPRAPAYTIHDEQTAMPFVTTPELSSSSSDEGELELEDESLSELPTAAAAPHFTTTGNIVVVTARPTGIMSFVKRYTANHLRTMRLEQLTVLSGSLLRSASIQAIVGKKFQNFQQHRCLFPEYKFIINGDAGQGDAAFAALALESYPDQVLAAFIHDVLPGRVTGDGGDKDVYAQAGIKFYDTYIGAAHAAMAAGVFSSAEVAQVVAAAESEFREVAFPSNTKGLAMARAAKEHMDADLSALQDALEHTHK